MLRSNIHRLLLLSLIALSAGIPAASAADDKGDPLDRYEARVFKSSVISGGTLNYRLLVPKGYDAKAADSYPLVLLLHGAGERGTDNKAQLKWGGAEMATDLQAAGKCFVIAPQCPNEKQWVNTPWDRGSYSAEKVKISDQLSMAIEAVEKVIAEFHIDVSRVYVVGLSMGGYGTWDAIARRPDLFAAAVPICGSGDPSAAQKIKGISIWAFHGGADTTVPVKGTREMVEALKNAGAAEPKLQYTEFAGVGHNSWSPAFATKGLWEWLLKQKK